ncbi:hypothetical protein N7532_001025 [Penicillium argentinense]|uniref:Uncharacterized protein n=1 Tax=Penicillium argentinense TaxID=1131581 RepID=A0A9W9KLA9_9EURO|nr:uncharacterized protein N7532_001025 [Penicillium argentinense]KAJ5110490.1 hypothetical protein N7532_001025 [Penicillium argentinense]
MLVANAAFVNGTKAGSMYIKPEQNYAVGILLQTRVAYLNGTVSGFALFATQLVYNNNTLLEAQFWAKKTNTTGVYGLTWTLDDSEPNGDFPVVVKASGGLMKKPWSRAFDYPWRTFIISIPACPSPYCS